MQPPLLKQLYVLNSQKRWLGAASSTSDALPTHVQAIEGLLHDLCHAATLGLPLPPPDKHPEQTYPDLAFDLEDYVAIHAKKLRKLEADRNEIHTLAAEMHLLSKLGVGEHARFCFLLGTQRALSIRALRTRVQRRMNTQACLRDVARVQRAARYHSKKVRP